MTKELMTIVGPGDALPDEGRAVLLVDDQIYPARDFEKVAESITLGSCVEEVEGGYRLTKSCADRVMGFEKLAGHVMFFASDDTHVNTFLRIAPYCAQHTMVVHGTIDFGARAALKKNGQVYEVHGRNMKAFQTANIALIGNDNGKEEHVFIHHCHRFGIPVVSLQEAVNMDFEGPPYRMRWADRSFLGGVHALRYHERVLSVITGNPRYDDIRPEPLPNDPYVLINCNFTFGVAHDWSRAWLEQTIEAARRADLDYRITVHPRDETDLTGIENVLDSNAFVVHEQIAGCYVLVSRDSSVPYEALLMNRHALYYNPFDEQERCLNEDDTGLIHKANTVDDLSTTLKKLRDEPLPQDHQGGLAETFQTYFTGIDGSNAKRVARALQVMLDGEYFGRPDAMRDAYAITWTRMFTQNVLRPKLRQIGWARALWKFMKYRVFRFPHE